MPLKLGLREGNEFLENSKVQIHSALLQALSIIIDSFTLGFVLLFSYNVWLY